MSRPIACFRPQVSLRTLLLTMPVIGAAIILAQTWEPWVRESTLPGWPRGRRDPLTFSPDGRYALASFADSVWKYDLATGAVVQTIAGNPPESPGVSTTKFYSPVTVRFTPCGKFILTEYRDFNTGIRSTCSQATKYDAATGKRLFRTQAPDLEWSRDGRYLLVFESGVSVLDTVTGKLSTRLTAALRDKYGRFSPRGDVLLVRNGMDLVGWNVTSGESQFRFSSPPDLLPVTRFSDDGSTFVTGASHNKSVRSAVDGRLLLEGPPGRLEFASFSKEGRVAALGIKQTQRHLLVVADLATGQCVQQYDDSLRAADVAPDGRTVLVAGWRGAQTAVLDAHSLEVLFEFEPMRDAAYSEYVGPRTEPPIFTRDGRRAMLFCAPTEIWRKRRPEHWWGVAWLPAIWVLLACSAGLLYSAVRDVSARRAKPAES